MDNMIVKTILAIALTSFSPAIVSANVCEPTSELYKVFGVESWDTLNVRSGPSTKYEVVDELAPNETGVLVTGNFLAKTDTCQTACDSNNSDNIDLLKECFSKGNIWYEVHISQSEVGWASAKHLIADYPIDDTAKVESQSPEKQDEDQSVKAPIEQETQILSLDTDLLLAQTFIADIEQFIGSGESDFDLGFVTEFSKIREVKEGNWSPSLEAAFERFEKYALGNQNFQKYFSEKNLMREQEANERIAKTRDELYEQAGLMRSWAQSNLLDPRTEEILQILDRIDVALAAGEIEELESTLTQATALTKEVGISIPVATTSTNESPFVSDSVYLFGNFSGRAQHIFKGISGEPELGDSTVSVCLYSTLDKWQLFTMRDYLSGGLEATKIDLYENNCSGDEDVFAALGSRMITGGFPADFSVSYEELQRIDRNATLAVKEKFDVISDIFQDEVLKSEKSGYGMLSFGSSVSATCAVIQEDLSLHIDALNANGEVLQLFGDVIHQIEKSENVIDAFRKVQRKECGYVYAAAPDLVTLIEASQNNKLEFDFLPFWVSTEVVAAIASERTETEKARLSDEEARLQSAKLQEQAAEALRQKALSEQSELRAKYEVRFSVIVDELATATKSAIDFGFTHSPLDSNYVQEFQKLPMLDVQDSSVSVFDPIIFDIQDLALEKWEQTGFLTEKMDYGLAVYNGRSLEGVIFDVKVELKNRLIGDFDTYCRTIRAVIDDDFDMWRNVEIDQCGLTGENWRLANSFESQWIVETGGQP